MVLLMPVRHWSSLRRCLALDRLVSGINRRTSGRKPTTSTDRDSAFFGPAAVYGLATLLSICQPLRIDRLCQWSLIIFFIAGIEISGKFVDYIFELAKRMADRDMLDVNITLGNRCSRSSPYLFAQPQFWCLPATALWVMSPTSENGHRGNTHAATASPFFGAWILAVLPPPLPFAAVHLCLEIARIPGEHSGSA